MIGKDKLYHFGICAAVTFFIGLLHDPVAGALSGIFLGIGKEYGDHKAPGNIWSWGDLAADALGVVAGGVLSWQLYYAWFFVSLRMALGSIVLYH